MCLWPPRLNRLAQHKHTHTQMYTLHCTLPLTTLTVRMRVNQLVASGPYASITFDSLHLENLVGGQMHSLHCITV